MTPLNFPESTRRNRPIAKGIAIVILWTACAACAFGTYRRIINQPATPKLPVESASPTATE